MNLETELIDIGLTLFRNGLATSTSGNLSARLEDRVVFSPTGVSLADLQNTGLAATDPQGAAMGALKPTKELGLHLAIYRRHPQARAIIHVHPVHCIAVTTLMDAAVDRFLPAVTPQMVMRAGRVPLVPYFPPGSGELADAVGAAEARSAVALQNHGLVVFAADFRKAMGILEEIEENCRARLLAGPACRLLNDEQVAALLNRTM